MGGCTGKILKARHKHRVPSVTGILNITINKAYLIHQTSVFRMDPYLLVKVSNIQYQTSVIKSGDKSPQFNQKFTFPINSCYQMLGRKLQICVFDKGKVGSDNQIGYGIIDLEPTINYKTNKQHLKCFINYDRKPAGYINIIAQFMDQKAKTLSFRFLYAELFRRSSGFGKLKLSVKVIIGQQILSTQKKNNLQDDILVFSAFQSLGYCQIFIMNDDNQIGNIKIKLNKLLQSTQQETFEQIFKYKYKDVGIIRFQTLVGQNVQFSQINPQSYKTNLPSLQYKTMSSKKQSQNQKAIKLKDQQMMELQNKIQLIQQQKKKVGQYNPQSYLNVYNEMNNEGIGIKNR